MVFKLENGNLVLDRDEIRGIKEFKRLLERDKGSEGDRDGRKKYQAFKEFFYIMCCKDPRFIFKRSGKTEEEIHIFAVKESDLPDNFKPDEDIKAALAKYEEIILIAMPSVSYTLKLIEGIRTSEEVVEGMIIGIRQVLKASQKQLAENETPDLASILGFNKTLSEQVKTLHSMANDLPNTLRTLKDELAKMVTEEANSNISRGGKIIGNRADPK